VIIEDLPSSRFYCWLKQEPLSVKESLSVGDFSPEDIGTDSWFKRKEMVEISEYVSLPFNTLRKAVN